MPKATKAAIEQRVEAVVQLLLRGVSRRSIVQYAAKTWHVRSRQADEYIARANEAICEAGRTHNETEVGKAVKRLTRVINRAFTAEQLGMVIAAQRELSRLLGLNAPEQHRIIHNTDGLETMTERELLNIWHKGKNGGDIPDLTSTGSRPN